MKIGFFGKQKKDWKAPNQTKQKKERKINKIRHGKGEVTTDYNEYKELLWIFENPYYGNLEMWKK